MWRCRDRCNAKFTVWDTKETKETNMPVDEKQRPRYQRTLNPRDWRHETFVLVADPIIESLPPLKGPIIQIDRPVHPNASGGPWVWGIMADGRTAWV